MSKYISLDWLVEQYFNLDADYYGKYVREDLLSEDTPKIEVSEDCISREYLEEQYWQILIPKGMVNTDVELGINIGIDKMHDVIKNAPSVVPKQVTIKLEDSIKSMRSTIEEVFKELDSKLKSLKVPSRADDERESENKCHRHGIRLEDGIPIYECIGCDKQDCERI